MLEFWATWCAPCIEQIPHLNALQDTLADQPIRFVSLTDEDRDIVEPFLIDIPMQSAVGLDTDRSTAEAFGVGPIPQVVLIDAEGTVRAFAHPRELTAALLQDLVAGRKITLQAAPSPSIETMLDPAMAQGDSLLATLPDSSFFEASFGEGEGGPGFFRPKERKALSPNRPLVFLALSLLSEDEQSGLNPFRRLKTDIDIPDSLARKIVQMRASFPNATEATFRDSIRVNLAEVLGLTLFEEARPDTVLVLRPSGEVPLRLERAEGFQASSADGVLSFTGTADRFAGFLWSTLQTPVFDETTYDEGFRFRLIYDPETIDLDDPKPSDVEAFTSLLRDETGLTLEAEVRERTILVVREK